MLLLKKKVLKETLLLLKIESLIIDYRARDWCKMPYPGHKSGCPNYNHRSDCPPKVETIENYFDLTKDVHAVVCQFNLKEHIEKMRLKHPNWSERQLKCVLYWQPRVRKELKEMIKQYSLALPGSISTTCPEAMGVNVIKTMKKIGLPIHPRPQDIVYKIGFIGYKKEN